jgi:hypothetical protein
LTPREWCASHAINLNTYYNIAVRLRKTAAEELMGSNKQSKNEINQTWAEVYPEKSQVANYKYTSETNAAMQTSKLVVEIEAIRIIVDTAYPTDSLAALIRRLIKPC